MENGLHRFLSKITEKTFHAMSPQMELTFEASSWDSRLRGSSETSPECAHTVISRQHLKFV